MVMKMYKYELHCHTNGGSKCGKRTPTEQVEFYKAMGFTGLCITDHFFNGNCSVDKRLPWKERVEEFLKPYKEAKKRGEEIGIDVFFGFENAYGGTDFVILGLDEQWLLDHPYCDKYSASEFATVAHESGALVTQAHPFREAKYIEMIRLLPRQVDAVEVINANRTDFENKMADLYADNYGITKVVGSDNHKGPEQERTCAVSLKEKANDITDIIKAIKENRHEIAVYNTEDLLK